MPTRKNLKMVVIGDFPGEDISTIIYEAEYRGCTQVTFSKIMRGTKWKNCHYLVCSEFIFLKHRKFFEKAAERKIVVVIANNKKMKVPKNIHKCKIHEQYGCIGIQ